MRENLRGCDTLIVAALIITVIVLVVSTARILPWELPAEAVEIEGGGP